MRSNMPHTHPNRANGYARQWPSALRWLLQVERQDSEETAFARPPPVSQPSRQLKTRRRRHSKMNTQRQPPRRGADERHSKNINHGFQNGAAARISDPAEEAADSWKKDKP
jgi:hypothetical protein